MISASDIERRISIALAIGRYVKALDSYHAASREFKEACSYVRSRSQWPLPVRNEDQLSTLLVTADEEGNFEVEEIDFA